MIVMSLATWQPGIVFKNLHTQLPEIIIEFQHKKLIHTLYLLKIIDLYLEICNFKYYFGFAFEEIFEL